MTEAEILRRRFMLKVHFLKEIRYRLSSSWRFEQFIAFRELPDDFKIDQIDNETGEYSPTEHALNELNEDEVAVRGRSEYEVCLRLQHAFVVKKKKWTRKLQDALRRNKKIID